MKKRQFINFKDKALALRKQGKTYRDINAVLGTAIPKSTFSTWLHSMALTEVELSTIEARKRNNILNGNKKADFNRKLRKEVVSQATKDRYAHLHDLARKNDIAKICLAILYLCEGSKRRSSGCCFGNSDPHIISLFLELLRNSYETDESKFRCTVQCRADQDPEKLALFWSGATGIPLKLFYPPQIDKRTIGKPTKKLDYKGVCKIDYFSVAIYNELQVIGALL
jgi:hypothetical protein